LSSVRDRGERFKICRCQRDRETEREREREQEGEGKRQTDIQTDKNKSPGRNKDRSCNPNYYPFRIPLNMEHGSRISFNDVLFGEVWGNGGMEGGQVTEK
jgi:hypothetical protein